MILNKLQTMSFARLLHVALSCLCVLALVLGLASGALAAAGDPSGSLTDFPSFSRSLRPASTYFAPGIVQSTLSGCVCRSVIVLPVPLVSGSIDSAPVYSPENSSGHFNDHVISFRDCSFIFYDHLGSQLSSSGFTPSFPLVVPDNTFFIVFTARFYMDEQVPLTYVPGFVGGSYSDFVYSSDPLSSDILDGVTAIAQSLYDLESGPYYGVSGVSVDRNGDLQHTLTQNASLEDLLNALGIAGTDTNHVIRGIYNNFGSYFTLYSIDDSTSSTTQVYRGLPQYVNALGQSLTDGINRLQRDHDLLYQQTADLSDALYADTTSNPSESWSVAEWLRGIFNSINSFFTSFWSPAETDLKSAAEDGMQEAADRGIAGSADQVGSMDDLGSGFSSFGDTGNVGAGDILNSLTSGDYSFFSETTQDNLSYHPPVSENRGLRSAPSDPVEYVDELSRNRDYLREVLGLP